MPCGPVWAASDITIAAIATGRLYVVGKTEHPHTAVTLDDQFRTESDETGKFQYELIYHPARCIVSASIDGKAYEAVVTNCSQQCQVGPQNQGVASPTAAAAPPLPAAQSAGTPPVANAATPPGRRPPKPVPPVRTGAVAAPAAVQHSVPTRPAGEPATNASHAHAGQKPAQPQRAAQRATTPNKPALPPKPARKPRPSGPKNPDGAEPPIAD
jgi:hypothetical protein